MNYWTFIKKDWPLLAFGFLMAAVSGPGQTYFVGLFRDPITEAFGISIGDFGLIFSSATLVSAGVFFWTGKFIDRWTIRYTTVFFCCLFAAAAFTVGLAPHVAFLCLSIFGIRHLGQALMGHISGTTMARYFVHNRAKATSLAAMGYSASEAIFPICIVFLIAAIGWRMSWTVVAFGIVGVFLPLALLLLKANRRDLSLDIEVPLPQAVPMSAKPQADKLAAASHVTPEEALSSEEDHWTRKDVLTDIRFYLLFPAMLAGPYILTGFFFHQASLASERGLGLEVIAGFFTGFAMTKILGSLVYGGVVDRYGPIYAYPLPIILLGLSLMVLGLSESLTSVLIFYLLSGFGVGASIPVSGALWPRLYGTRHLGAVRSLISSVMVLATGLAPASYGYLLDAGVTISQIAIGTAIYCALVLGPVGVFVARERRKMLAEKA